jgi:hypothetical protein
VTNYSARTRGGKRRRGRGFVDKYDKFGDGRDIDSMIPYPNVNGMAAHGALLRNCRQTDCAEYGFRTCAGCGDNIPISGIGGINTWRDAVEFCCSARPMFKSAQP